MRNSYVYDYECFACTYVCVPCACLVPAEVKEQIKSRGSEVTYRWLGATMWVLGSECAGSVQEQVLLTTEPALQPSLTLSRLLAPMYFLTC